MKPQGRRHNRSEPARPGSEPAGLSGSFLDFVNTGSSRREQPLHLRELPDGSLAARTPRQVPLEYPLFRRGQRAQHITCVVEASHVHHGASFIVYFPADPSVIAQLGAVWLYQVPMRTELIQSLTAAIAGIMVADVVIERMTVIGELRSPVGAWGAAQRSILRATCRGSAARGGHRRPYARAGAGTGGRGGAVVLEQVDGPAGAVDQCRSRAESGSADRDDRHRRVWGDGRGRRRGGLVVAAGGVRSGVSASGGRKGEGHGAAGQDKHT